MNILYISIGSFWKNAALKFFQHHDALFNAMQKYIPDMQIHLGVPMKGATYLRKLIEDHNDTRVIDTWKNLPYHVYPDLYTGDYDAMIINGSEDFQDVQAPYRTIPTQEIYDYIYNKALACIHDDKPCILFDPDNYINENICVDPDKNLARRVHDAMKNYKKYFLAGPFELGVDRDSYNSYVFTPFTINPDDHVSPTIRPLSERRYITRYVGNNYMRDNFFPYFDELSNYGKVQVVGSGWTKYHSQNSKIEWTAKSPLTTDKVADFYGNSMVGLYGTTTRPSFRKGGHYTLRIREYYQAGILVIPEADHILASKREFGITTNDLNDLHLDSIYDQTYDELVKYQRSQILEFFNADGYAQLWCELLQM